MKSGNYWFECVSNNWVAGRSRFVADALSMKDAGGDAGCYERVVSRGMMTRSTSFISSVLLTLPRVRISAGSNSTGNLM